MAEIILLVLEIIGAIAFAVSGAFAAIKAKFDVFGVIVIGCITAIGGGITRDMLIGSVPPAIFSKLYIVGIAACTSLVVFVLSYIRRKDFENLREKVDHINNIFSAIGLASYTVTGIELAFVKGLSDNIFLSVTLGVLTGVGGGVLRDILTENTPYIFKKHVYAVTAIVGGGLYYVLRLFIANTILPSAAAMLFIIGMRLLAAKYRWSLPKIHINEETTLKFVKREEEQNPDVHINVK